MAQAPTRNSHLAPQKTIQWACDMNSWAMYLSGFGIRFRFPERWGAQKSVDIMGSTSKCLRGFVIVKDKSYSHIYINSTLTSNFLNGYCIVFHIVTIYSHIVTYTIPETNIAMENPPFWWYLPGNSGIFYGYVSLTEGNNNSISWWCPNVFSRYPRWYDLVRCDLSKVNLEITQGTVGTLWKSKI